MCGRAVSTDRGVMNPVTVLMSVYNDEKFLRQSIESVLGQSFADFEFLIINDASTDSTPAILQEYARRDNRIRVIDNERNMGLTASLNKGLNSARGKYIARMDSDDISLKERLQRQVDFLGKHPEIGVLGSGAEIIDDDGNTTSTFSPSTSPAVIRWRLLFGNCMLHSTVMFRKNIVLKAGGYPSDCFIAQDYDLWSRLMFNTDISQLPDILVRYRQNANAISIKNYDKQAETSIRVVQKNLTSFFGIELSFDIVKALCDSYNVRRQFPLTDGTIIKQASQLILEFRQKYFERYDLTGKEKREIDRDVVEKLLSLSRANAGTFPIESIITLYRAFMFKQYTVFNGSFWISIVKVVLRIRRKNESV